MARDGGGGHARWGGGLSTDGDSVSMTTNLAVLVSSSRSSCGRQGGRRLRLHGLRVLAAPAQVERHHPEVHCVLLPPLPHSKLVNSREPFLRLWPQPMRALWGPVHPFVVCLLGSSCWFYCPPLLSPHTKQHPHLHLL